MRALSAGSQRCAAAAARSLPPLARRAHLTHPRIRGTQGAWTALICAAREGHVELAELLLAADADVAAKSSVRILSSRPEGCRTLPHRRGASRAPCAALCGAAVTPLLRRTATRRCTGRRRAATWRWLLRCSRKAATGASPTRWAPRRCTWRRRMATRRWWRCCFARPSSPWTCETARGALRSCSRRSTARWRCWRCSSRRAPRARPGATCVRAAARATHAAALTVIVSFRPPAERRHRL